MNVAITRLFIFFVILFALLVGWTSRWTVFEQDKLENNAFNQRGVLREQRIPRGVIRAADGSALARSQKGPNGTYTRRYPEGSLFAHAVGYSFLTVGRFGLEQSRNDELTGKESEVETVLDQLAESSSVATRCARR